MKKTYINELDFYGYEINDVKCSCGIDGARVVLNNTGPVRYVTCTKCDMSTSIFYKDNDTAIEAFKKMVEATKKTFEDCPSCGSDNIGIKHYSFGDYFKVRCNTCESEGPRAISEETAKKLWNTRHEKN